MELIWLTHPNGQKAVCIDHDGSRACKAVADQTQDGRWHEANVQFPLLSGEPRILAIGTIPDEVEAAAPTKRQRKKRTEILESPPASDDDETGLTLNEDCMPEA